MLSDLNWSIIGAIPKMCQTAYGSLTAALEVIPTCIHRGNFEVNLSLMELRTPERVLVLLIALLSRLSKSDQRSCHCRELGNKNLN